MSIAPASLQPRLGWPWALVEIASLATLVALCFIFREKITPEIIGGLLILYGGGRTGGLLWRAARSSQTAPTPPGGDSGQWGPP